MAKQKSLPKLPHGEGSFSYRNDRILMRKRIKLADGSIVSKSVYGDTPKECMSKMKELEKELEKDIQSTDRIVLVDAMNKWLAQVKKNTIKPQSYQRLESTLRNQIEPSKIGHMRYQLISAEQIQGVIQELNDKRYSYSIIKKTYDLLNDFFRYVSAKDQIRNPMLLVTMPTRSNVQVETKTIEFFEQNDIDKFVEECKTTWKTGTVKYRYGYILAANIYLGMRAGELLALQWKDIDFEKNTIYVCKTTVERNNPEYDDSDPEAMKMLGITKTINDIQSSTKVSKNRYVPMNSKAKELILAHMKVSKFTEPENYVISTKSGRPNTIKHLSEAIKQIEINAETEVRAYGTHVLRHTCASLYFRAGVPVTTIAQILGHSADVCQKTYIHFVEEQLQNAAAKIDVIEI